MTARKPPGEHKPNGRPTSYTKAIGEAICKRIACGQSLTAMCREEHMPDMDTVYRWIRHFPEFHDLYAESRVLQGDTMAEQMLDVAESEPERDEFGKVDTGMVAHNRLKIDVLKWRAARLKPKVYGDKVQQEHSGPDGGPIVVSTGVPMPPIKGA